jgi:hypothetical protein
MFFILKGEGTLRNAAEKRAVRTGAFICAPACSAEETSNGVGTLRLNSRLPSRPSFPQEIYLSNPTLESIERELKQLNANMAEANDIAMLQAYSAMPADLETESRKALRALRDKLMLRARDRAAL